MLSSVCRSPIASASPKYFTLMRFRSGMIFTMTMLFHWHHSDRGMSTILMIAVNSRMAIHQFPVRS